MSRALRILFEGAYYHVINKGAGDSFLFLDQKDYQVFLKTAKEACVFFNVQIVAYCLMDTHYHLLVHTPSANLPRFMRHVNGVFTQRRNQRYKTNGSIFKGRYSAIIVEDEEYLLKCIRYIHLNPIKANIVDEKRQYKWSSHNNYVEGKDDNKWLHVTKILERFDSKPKRAINQYLKFFKSGNDEATEQFYQMKKKLNIFGTKEYVDDIKLKFIHSERICNTKEMPEAKKIINDKTLKIIFKNVCKEFNVKKEALYKSEKKYGNLPKQMAICLIKELTQLPNEEIAKILQLGSYKTISSHLYRFKKNLSNDVKLTKLYNVLQSRCSQAET